MTKLTLKYKIKLERLKIIKMLLKKYNLISFKVVKKLDIISAGISSNKNTKVIFDIKDKILLIEGA